MWPKRPPDLVIADNYLLRWHLIPRNRWFNVYLHNIRHSDDDRALHDHPWWNVSVILKGSYHEVTPSTDLFKYKITHYPRWSVIFRRATDSHRLVLDSTENSTWTLFITGPKIREWGFHCPQGWVHWKKFTNQQLGASQSGPGCGD